MADLIGKELGGFQIEALLGKGSMAQVYQARQLALRRHVALKVLEEGLFTPNDSIRRFLREAEAMAMLEHPHIVPVYSAGEANPYYFFAMRLVRGGSLADAMRTGVQRRIAIRWIYEICQALAFAHGGGVIHRDLKPSNVLIHDGVAVLADFGLARLRDLSTITQRGFLLGTPLYMAPEQTQGVEAGPATDCFALGVIMYELLLGRHPFSPNDKKHASRIEARAELFDRIQRCDYPLPTALDKTVPPAVESVIVRALTREIKDRYPDGAAMLRDVEAAYKALPDHDQLIQHTEVDFESRRVRSSAELLVTEAIPSPTPAPAPAPKADKQRGFGRYQLRDEIGHGGQGVVYRAHDPVLDRDVALKVLQNRRTEDKRMEELFTNEARVAARLSHPHIIPVYDFGVEDSNLYITMQLIEGRSLDRIMEVGKPLPPYFALDVLMQAGEALAFAHAQGVVHLDVKPSNIMIGPSTRILSPGSLAHFRELGAPHIYLLDFTMAAVRRTASTEHESSTKERRRRTAGTIAYAAPEQLSGQDAQPTPAYDIFSLGVVLYEMLTGTRLFPGESVSLMRLRLSQGAIPSPSSRAPGIPPELDTLCARMLAARPEDRPQTARDVATAALSIAEALDRQARA
jgi:serine/threonine protein kinase